MTIDRDTWPELVYRFVEYYRWEPDKLGPSTSDFYRKIRSHEVPLNFLFNLLLYALPPDLRRSTIAIDGCLSAGRSVLHVLNPWRADYCQPDVHLESESERVFLELKIHARTDLDQAQKYGLAHAKLAEHDTSPKKAVLIYITGREFSLHWSPRKDAPATGYELAQRLAAADLSSRLLGYRDVRSIEAAYRVVVPSLAIAFTTWQRLGEHLERHISHVPQVAQDFIGGFLKDLSRRELWKAGA